MSFTESDSGAALTGGNGATSGPVYIVSMAYSPNSNVASVQDSVNGNWTYGYDDFNRLISSNKNSGQQTYSYLYDRFGNRWQQNAPQGGSTFTATFSGGNNRIDSATHDASGNVTKDPTTGANYTFDAENRITTVNGTAVTYTYDADSQRVEKNVNAVKTDYVYDLGGHAIAEISGSGTLNRQELFAGGKHLGTYTNNTTYFSHGDWLGTERVRSDMTGAPCETIQSLPFGDGQSTSGTCGDPSTRHFTGKERDTETNLDYFGARYYGNGFGRFVTADPKALALRHLLDPQKLNKYSYVINNPMNLFDPDGMEEVTITYRTFIPTSSVTVAGRTNGGDNRGFSTAKDASSRTSITIKIETDPHIRPGNPIISVDGKAGGNTGHAGQSTILDGNGNVTKTATATTGLPTATGTRDENGTPVINIQQDTKNPLSPGPEMLTPGISANLNVMVYQDASTTQVTGTAAQFPASELNVTREDGTTTPVVQYMPPKDATPWSLAKPDRDVNEKKETPACNGDEQGCPK